MFRLEESKALHRKIRQDDPTDLGIPNWTLLRDAIKAGETSKALDILDYIRLGSERNIPNLISQIEEGLTRTAAAYGEAELEKIFRQRLTEQTSNWLKATPGVEECLQRCTETQRFQNANLTVTEESERYVLTYNPCGTGGRLRRNRVVGTTRKEYPWSWGKKGVPYYCAHCCVHWEIIPIELRGYPIRITMVGEMPDDSCVQYFYKKPELIPEEYFVRIGKAKTIK